MRIKLRKKSASKGQGHKPFFKHLVAATKKANSGISKRGTQSHFLLFNELIIQAIEDIAVDSGIKTNLSHTDILDLKNSKVEKVKDSLV